MRTVAICVEPSLCVPATTILNSLLASVKGLVPDVECKPFHTPQICPNLPLSELFDEALARAARISREHAEAFLSVYAFSTIFAISDLRVGVTKRFVGHVQAAASGGEPLVLRVFSDMTGVNDEMRKQFVDATMARQPKPPHPAAARDPLFVKSVLVAIDQGFYVLYEQHGSLKHMH